MESYRLNDKVIGKRKKQFIWTTLILSTLVFVGLNIDSINWHLKTTLFALPIMAIIFFVSIRLGVKVMVEAWKSYVLELDDEVMIQSHIKTDRVVIAFDEITKIIGYNQGVSIQTNERLKKIFISKDLEAFEEVVSRVESRSGLTVQKAGIINLLFQQITLPILLIISVCIFCISIDEVAIVVTGIYLIAYLGWSMFTIQKSIIDFGRLGSLLTGIIAILAIAGRLYYILMY